MPINVRGIPKVDVLVALYNAAQPAALHGGYPRRAMDRAEADELLQEGFFFSYVNGRALFVDLTPDEIDVSLYDEKNGRLCAVNALAPIVTRAPPRLTDGSDADFVRQVLAAAPLAAGPKA